MLRYMETAMRMKKTKLNGVFTSIIEKNHYLKTELLQGSPGLSFRQE